MNTLRNYYKTCRENAGMTQEYAAGALHISVRTLSDYENDNSNVPDDIVNTMCDLYSTNQLALWHLKNKSPLGKFLPDIYEPITLGDMVFSLAVAVDASSEAYETIRSILRDRKLESSEAPQFAEAIGKAKEANENLSSIILYAEDFLKKQSLEG